MRIISFAWTTEALVVGRKVCTRRDWQQAYARSFKAGEMVAAYERSPRIRGKEVGTIRLTAAPEFTAALPDEDFEREGFGWMQERHQLVDGVEPRVMWQLWQHHSEPQWVVRFELVSLTPYGEELRARALASMLSDHAESLRAPQLPLGEGDA